ncbi:hypothetical protein [Desulfosarcina ovata]|uniref:Uncharacterized protein n=2 Tax=Desulfosarcina ovata TaxID=83564 RepID=A0A5K8AD93_9BACT|nr:hypothetical protein [Desulfosarcina ovata]BBO84063.1 hypothetical protein DSCO28_46290 [Desulfosarcina ovata subsp. sediminis]BBO90537.1 hypothetical protein DSCOOX_37170 [Desulfosarcina ovata subsp. ovata]
MNSNFQIALRHSAGNLHVNLWGEFNGMCAWELLKILKQNGGSGRVFVNTQAIRHVAGDGVDLFRTHMAHRQIPQDWLYFKGKKGFTIAPSGSRVLICRKGSAPIAERPGTSKKSIKIVRACLRSLDQAR